MQDILKQLQVHIPFDQLFQKHLDKVLREQINPEIAFTCSHLDRFADRDYTAVGNILRNAGRFITFHGPFMDLRPGAIDPKIRQASLERFRRVFEIAAAFRPHSIVFHPSYDEKYYVSSGRNWLANSVDTWKQLVPLAEGLGTRIALENVYEADPGYPALLLGALPPERIGFCFDTGHFNVFSRVPLDEWMDRLGSRIIEVHLHDNRGGLDEHLPVGEGTFPFLRLFSILKERKLRPILTVEAHSEKNLARTMASIKALDLLEGLGDGRATGGWPARPETETSVPGKS
ncbi:MAG TPA: sugar phosphate isomerase/epimerase family protein [Syntrophales bacterium]|nr:sugar phosphate isomerase/epimerase family protein [Syntrophales bacterium]